MEIPKFKLITHNDMNHLIDNGNKMSEKLTREGHTIQRVNIDFDRHAFGTARKPTHILTILYLEKNEDLKPALSTPAG